MEFTDAFPCHGIAARLSPDGRYVAAVLKGGGEGVRVAIHQSGNGELVQELTVLGTGIPRTSGKPTTNIGPTAMFGSRGDRWELLWAPNSTRLALFNHLAAQVTVWEVDGGRGGRGALPVSSIQENVLLGVDRVLWLPDSLHFLAFLSHRVGVRLWRIDRRFPQACLPHPKYSGGDRGVCFSGDGRWVAVLHRRGLGDFIVVYARDRIRGTWTASQTVNPPESASLEDICFAPLREIHAQSRPPLIAWESPAFTSRIFVFAPDGCSCKVISHDLPPESVEEGKEEGGEGGTQQVSGDSSLATAVLIARGFERMIWSRTGWIAALTKDAASFAIWNTITLRLGAQMLVGPAAVQSGTTIVFKERLIKELRPDGTVSDRSKYESGFQLQMMMATIGDSRNRSGGSPSRLLVEFSHDTTFVAAHSGQYPTCVWIYNVVEMALVAVLQQLQSVRSLSWSETSNSLVVATEAPTLFVWQPSGCLCIPQPTVKDPRLVKWASGRDVLLIGGTGTFSLAVPDWATY